VLFLRAPLPRQGRERRIRVVEVEASLRDHQRHVRCGLQGDGEAAFADDSWRGCANVCVARRIMQELLGKSVGTGRGVEGRTFEVGA